MSKGQKITIAIVLIIILGVIGYLMFFKSDKPLIPENGSLGDLPDATNGEDSLSGDQGSVLSRISDSERSVFGFWIDQVSGDVVYITTSGRVLGANSLPNQEISLQEISAINKIQPGVDGDMVIVSFGDPKNPSWGVYDTGDNSWRPLPVSIEYLTWGSNKNTLLGTIAESGDRILAEINLEETLFGNGSIDYTALIRNFNIKDIDIYWAEPNRIIVAEKPSSFYNSKVWEIDRDSLSMNLLVGATNSFKSNWIHGHDVVFAINNGNEFFVLNKELQNNLFVPFTTYPSKCAPTETGIYCFVPREVPDNQTWEDYDKKKFKTNDDLLVINRTSMDLENIEIRDNSNLNITIDAKNPFYSNGKLYFINNIDNSLYSVDLEIEADN